MPPIPDRCRACVHWLGHLSGSDHDIRCNRQWGHEPTWGLLYDETMADEPYARPAIVTAHCQVAEWGIPMPELDDHGNPIGQAIQQPHLIDAFIPRRLQPPDEGSWIRVKTRHGTITVNAQELHEYLMSTPKQKAKLTGAFAKRNEDRARMQKEHSDTYKKMYGTAPKVIHGADQLPPYRRGLERVATGIPQLDRALKGGIPVGCRINISGRPDSGKSTLVNCMEGAFLRYYTKEVYDYILAETGDEEQAMEARANERIGLIKPEDFEVEYMMKAMNLPEEGRRELFNAHVEFIATSFAEESTQYVLTALTEDGPSLEEYRDENTYSYMLPIRYRIFTLDSIDASELAEDSFGAKMTGKVMGENSRLGAQARMLSKFFSKAYKSSSIPVTLILVSQHRTSNIQTGRASTSYHRGKAHPYFTLLELNTYMPKPDPTDTTHEVRISFGKVHVDAEIQRNDEITLHLRPGEGFTIRDNTVSTAMTDGMIVKSGSWVKYTALDGEEHKRQGANVGDVADWLEGLGLIDEVYDRLMGTVVAPVESFIPDMTTPSAT